MVCACFFSPFLKSLGDRDSFWGKSGERTAWGGVECVSTSFRSNSCPCFNKALLVLIWNKTILVYIIWYILSLPLSLHRSLPSPPQFPPPQVPGFKPPYQNAPYGPGSAPLFQNPPLPSQDGNDSLSGKMGFADWSAPYDSAQGGNRLPNHHTSTQSGPSPSPSSSSDGDEPNDSNAK